MIPIRSFLILLMLFSHIIISKIPLSAVECNSWNFMNFMKFHEIFMKFREFSMPKLQNPDTEWRNTVSHSPGSISDTTRVSRTWNPIGPSSIFCMISGKFTKFRENLKKCTLWTLWTCGNAAHTLGPEVHQLGRSAGPLCSLPLSIFWISWKFHEFHENFIKFHEIFMKNPL